ncbi:hypothetical protein BN1051_00841 [Arthrobacter saudimassiliensis]|uniref:Gram-positive cocci surface proteins LPxTG domain-containing protein n=1 Tax=Arthrobacter saudimassiliensis TaxID=1461584 RepID=A0A078MRQ9_9MICC|nr:hypothetical protein BN1051_00841 [Arthrobacter saudimassiliensis]
MQSSTPRRRGTRRLLAAGATAALAGTLSLASGAAAQAEGQYLEVSGNGTDYRSVLTDPVFAAELRLVPGAAAGSALWVRSSAEEPAVLSMAAVTTRSDSGLAGILEIGARASGEDYDRVPMGEPGQCAELARNWELAPGEVLRLDLEALLPLSAPNSTKSSTADFDLLFLLEPSTAAGAGGACRSYTEPEPEPKPQPKPQPEPGPGGDRDTEGTGAGDATVNGAGTGTDGGTGPDGPNPTGGPGQAAPGEAVAAVAAGTEPLQPGAALLDKYGRSLPSLAPASFESTVEPIARTLQGALMLVLGAAFCAAAVLRIRNNAG